MELSEKILLLMREKGYSYETMEKATGIAKSTLQRKISAGASKMFLNEIKSIAIALGQDAATLLEWRRTEEPQFALNKDIDTLTVEEAEKVQDYVDLIKSSRKSCL